jgi:hypothetical protein
MPGLILCKKNPSILKNNPSQTTQFLLTKIFFLNLKVIGKLSEGRATHIPYRDSKLTRLLQSSLSGHGHVSVSAIFSLWKAFWISSKPFKSISKLVS